MQPKDMTSDLGVFACGGYRNGADEPAGRRELTQTTVARVRSSLSVDPNVVRDRIRSRLETTPGRLNGYLIVLTILGVLAGLSAVVGAAQRNDSIDSVVNRSGPLAVQAQRLYRALSDADATAASAFLSSAAEPPDLRQRYQLDIADASAALAAAASAGTSGTSGTSGTAADPIARISAKLPVYTGLVETARTQNRLNLPVGAAYLREASALMRDELLPAASQLYQSETAQLDDDLSAGSSFPWLTVPLILVLLGGLVLAQRYLTRRTQRLLSRGMAVATVATVVMLLWVAVSWLDVSNQLGDSRDQGSAQVNLIAQARIAALQARADEALTLVARGSGDAFEKDFTDRMATISGAAGLVGQARNQAQSADVAKDLDKALGSIAGWGSQHKQVRTLDDGGQYPEAVTLALGDNAKTFNAIDTSLGDAIAKADGAFRDHASSADAAMSGATVGWSLLTIVSIAGLVLGLRQRIAEYR